MESTPEPEVSSDAVRIGLVGLGGHGRTIQFACEQAPNLEVISVFDPVLEETEAAAARFGCRVAHSFEALIRENDVEAIVLVTPNHLHRSQVEAALGF
jgi:predicted dehydrogenase